MIKRYHPIKFRSLLLTVILTALILPALADDAEPVSDSLVPVQIDEVGEQALDPLVPVQADEVAEPVRDPFWPVGYTQGGPTSSVAVAVAEVTPEVTLEIRPVSQEEWDKARTKLPRAGGIFIGSHPISKEKVEKMMMGGKVYYAGDLLVQTNEFVAFTWKIDAISFKSTKYELSPVTAERVMKESK